MADDVDMDSELVLNAVSEMFSSQPRSSRASNPKRSPSFESGDEGEQRTDYKRHVSSCIVTGCHNSSFMINEWRNGTCNEHGLTRGECECHTKQPFQLFGLVRVNRLHSAMLCELALEKKKLNKLVSGSRRAPAKEWAVCSRHMHLFHAGDKYAFPILRLGKTHAEIRRIVDKYGMGNSLPEGFNEMRLEGEELDDCCNRLLPRFANMKRCEPRMPTGMLSGEEYKFLIGSDCETVPPMTEERRAQWQVAVAEEQARSKALAAVRKRRKDDDYDWEEGEGGEEEHEVASRRRRKKRTPPPVVLRLDDDEEEEKAAQPQPASSSRRKTCPIKPSSDMICDDTRAGRVLTQKKQIAESYAKLHERERAVEQEHCEWRRSTAVGTGSDRCAVTDCVRKSGQMRAIPPDLPHACHWITLCKQGLWAQNRNIIDFIEYLANNKWNVTDTMPSFPFRVCAHHFPLGQVHSASHPTLALPKTDSTADCPSKKTRELLLKNYGLQINEGGKWERSEVPADEELIRCSIPGCTNTSEHVNRRYQRRMQMIPAPSVSSRVRARWQLVLLGQAGHRLLDTDIVCEEHFPPAAIVLPDQIPCRLLSVADQEKRERQLSAAARWERARIASTPVRRPVCAVRSCPVAGRMARPGESIALAYAYFPEDARVRASWVRALSNADPHFITPSNLDDAVICERHFAPCNRIRLLNDQYNTCEKTPLPVPVCALTPEENANAEHLVTLSHTFPGQEQQPQRPPVVVPRPVRTMKRCCKEMRGVEALVTRVNAKATHLLQLMQSLSALSGVSNHPGRLAFDVAADDKLVYGENSVMAVGDGDILNALNRLVTLKKDSPEQHSPVNVKEELQEIEEGVEGEEIYAEGEEETAQEQESVTPTMSDMLMELVSRREGGEEGELVGDGLDGEDVYYQPDELLEIPEQESEEYTEGEEEEGGGEELMIAEEMEEEEPPILAAGMDEDQKGEAAE